MGARDDNYDDIMYGSKSDAQHALTRNVLDSYGKFGYRKKIRNCVRSLVGDIYRGSFKRSIVEEQAESLAINAPGYWLADNLLALARWINDQPEPARVALAKGLEHDREKTALFWMLVSHYAKRDSAMEEWLEFYLETQEAESVSKEAVIIIDAYANGVFTSKASNIVKEHMAKWQSLLSQSQAGKDYEQAQVETWKKVLLSRREPFNPSSYKEYKDITGGGSLAEGMSVALMYTDVLEYFQDIMEAPVSAGSLREEIRRIFDNLLDSPEPDELELLEELEENQSIIDAGGNRDLAQTEMEALASAYSEKKDFYQLLNNIVMEREKVQAGPSAQKFALVLSREFILRAFEDIRAKNISKQDCNITVGSYYGFRYNSTGTDEREAFRRYDEHIEKEKIKACERLEKLSGYTYKLVIQCLVVYGIYSYWAQVSAFYEFLKGYLWDSGGLLAFLCFFSVPAFWLWLAYLFISVPVKIYTLLGKFRKKAADISRITAEYESKRKPGKEWIAQVLMEFVNLKAWLKQEEAKGDRVIDFLKSLKEEQYVRVLPDAGRKILVKHKEAEHEKA